MSEAVLALRKQPPKNAPKLGHSKSSIEPLIPLIHLYQLSYKARLFLAAPKKFVILPIKMK